MFPSMRAFPLWCLAALAGAPLAAQPLPKDLPLSAAAPDSFLVAFETTRGEFTIKARRHWSPLGVDRLYHLARSGYYDGNVIFRVGPTASYPGGMVVQFGLTNDSTVNAAWAGAGIDDEPVKVGHRRGMVMLARGGPRTRSNQLAIDLSPNTGLDTVNSNGVVGFPPIAEVVDGMDVLDRLERRHGNGPTARQDSISVGGKAYLDRAFPGLDGIARASVTTEWGARKQG
jgi:cyclophilin family peptidyl-prolyl cis-trans isomerase